MPAFRRSEPAAVQLVAMMHLDATAIFSSILGGAPPAGRDRFGNRNEASVYVEESICERAHGVNELFVSNWVNQPPHFDAESKSVICRICSLGPGGDESHHTSFGWRDLNRKCPWRKSNERNETSWRQMRLFDRFPFTNISATKS